MHMNTLSFSSVYIEAYGENLADGTHFLLGSGSAAVFKQPEGIYIFTARHVLNGTDMVTGELLDPEGAVPRHLRVCFAHSGSLEPIWVETTLLDDEHNPLWIEHPTNAAADVAAVLLPNELVSGDALIASLDPYRVIEQQDLIDPEFSHVVTLEDPGKNIPLMIPSELFVIGFPFGARGTWPAALWITGHVASEPDLDYDGQPYFMIDARTRKGLSGAPVVRHLPTGSTVSLAGSSAMVSGAPATQLVGIYSGRLNEASDLGRVWRVTVLQELLEAFDPGPLDTAF